MESNEELCKWRESDEVLQHSADVGAVVGVVIRCRHDIITAAASTSHWLSTAQLLQHVTQQTLDTGDTLE